MLTFNPLPPPPKLQREIPESEVFSMLASAVVDRYEVDFKEKFGGDLEELKVIIEAGLQKYYPVQSLHGEIYMVLQYKNWDMKIVEKFELSELESFYTKKMGVKVTCKVTSRHVSYCDQDWFNEQVSYTDHTYTWMAEVPDSGTCATAA
jgi:hypothetical protein